MHDFKFKEYRPTVIPFYRIAYLQKPFYETEKNQEYFKRVLTRLYEIACQHIPDFENTLIEEDSTLDGAVFFIATTIHSKFNVEIAFDPNGIRIGTAIETPWDINTLPVKKMYEHPDKNFRKFLQEILQSLVTLGLSSYHSGSGDYAKDVLENRIDDYEQYGRDLGYEEEAYEQDKHAFDVITNKLLPFVVPEGPYIIKHYSKTINHWVKKYPEYKDFITLSTDFIQHQYSLSSLESIHIDDDDDQYSFIDDILSISWDFLSESDVDYELHSTIEMNLRESYYPTPFCVWDFENETSEQHAKKADAFKKFFQIFENLDCYY
jgi:hypothetical protein